MTIELRTEIERIEIVLGSNHEARGASVNLQSGAYDTVTGQWVGAPSFRQAGLQVAQELGFAETLAKVLGDAAGQALGTIADLRRQAGEGETKITALTEENATVATDRDRLAAARDNLTRQLAEKSSELLVAKTRANEYQRLAAALLARMEEAAKSPAPAAVGELAPTT